MFIDIHAHAYRIAPPPHNGRPWFSTPEQVLARYDELGIERGVLLPLVGPEVYLPQSTDDILEMARRWPDRFVAFCNVDPRALTNSADAPLAALLSYYKEKGCRGIGEVMPNREFLDPRVQNLFGAAQEVDFPLIFDIAPVIGGTYGLVDEVGLPQIETCLERFPRLQVLGHGPAFWAEIGTLRTPDDRAGYPGYGIDAEGVVPKLMRRYDNLWGDLSAGSGYNALARDESYAVQFLDEFQDRLLFGTDICPPDMPIRQVDLLNRLKDEGKITTKVFNKIARLNAIKLLDLDTPQQKNMEH